jgi:HK97 family phage portal protein
MSFMSRVKALFGAEGSHRGPFMGMGELGGMYQIDPLGDGWQRNLEVGTYGARNVPAVYAAVMVVARHMNQCYPTHIKVIDGRFEKITTSAAYRVLMNPNKYQTSPDFILNLISMTLFDGEAFAIATRNDRSEINSLHLLPRGSCSPLIDDHTKEIFYAIGSNPLGPGGTDFVAPARDVLHLRFHTPRHPLIGESPIKAAALAIGINVALSKTQSAFFSNMNRPSGIISTDQVLNREQLTSLRKAFEDQAQGMASGKTPVLAGGLKWTPMSVTSQDAQLVEAQRMSIEDIARCFGIPNPLLGDLSHATLNNTEALVSHFLSMSLGSYLEHTERAFDRLFGLPGGTEYIEFDTSALIRTDFAGRIDALVKGVQGGLFTPNEARNREGVGPIKGGDSAYLQAQMVPIDTIKEQLDAKTAIAEAAAAAPPTAPSAEPSPPPPPSESSPKSVDMELYRALYAAKTKSMKAAA